MIDDFESDYTKCSSKVQTMTLHTAALFIVDNSPILKDKQAQDFHTYIARALFLCKCAQPDVQPTVAFLTTRVKELTEQDWYKLVQLICYLKATIHEIRSICINNLSVVYFLIDASFATHPDMKSHSGVTITMGKGVINSSSAKQKVNTQDTACLELVTVDDYNGVMLWLREFI